MRDLRVTFPEPCTEKWEEMSPTSGCNRFCASCDETIYDLSQLDFGEAKALLQREEKTCVRAALDKNGVIALKNNSEPTSRKMVLAIGVSLGLLATGAPLAANTAVPTGTISGKLEGFMLSGWVTATSADGKQYQAKITRYGHYKFKKLPPGTYILRFSSGCGEPWTSGPVVVQAKRTAKISPVTPDDSQCIIIGMMTIDQSIG